MVAFVDYSKVEHKDPYEDMVAAYDNAQLIKDAEYRLAHMDEIPTATSSRHLEQRTLDYFKELLAKKRRTKRENAALKLVKRNLVSDVLYHQNYEDNKEKYVHFYYREADWRHKTGLQKKDDYYSTKSRQDSNKQHLFRGWKFHLDVNPTPEDPLTKEISDFLKTLDIQHKIAHGGEEGKGMTVYTGSYEDTRKVAKLVYERFHDRMELPPLWNDNLMGEHFFNPLVCGRFLDGGRPFSTLYPAHAFGAGVSGRPNFFGMVLKDNENSSDLQDATMDLFTQNARNNGINLPDSDDFLLYEADNEKDRILFNSLAAYTMHKLYAEEFGRYYFGADLERFEQTFFGDYLPKRGSAERARWDKAANANIEFIKEHAGKDLAALKDIIDRYIPIDFSKVDAEFTLDTAALDKYKVEVQPNMIKFLDSITNDVANIPIINAYWSQYNSKNHRVSENENPPFATDYPPYGWKIRVFADNAEDWQKLASVLVPYLTENDVDFKTLSTLLFDGLIDNDFWRNPKNNQYGKAFTIYPANDELFRKTVREINYILEHNGLNDKQGFIYGDHQIGNHGRIFYRNVWPSANEPGYVPHAEADTDRLHYKPDDMEDPFLSVLGYPNDNTLAEAAMKGADTGAPATDEQQNQPTDTAVTNNEADTQDTNTTNNTDNQNNTDAAKDADIQGRTTMAKYTNFSDVKDNSEFLAFLKAEFGITDISKVADFEQTALLMSFKMHINDGDSLFEDVGKIEADKTRDKVREDLAQKMFGKKYGDLSAEKSVYAAYLQNEDAFKGMSADDILKKLNEVRAVGPQQPQTTLFSNKEEVLVTFGEFITDEEAYISRGHPENIPVATWDFIKQKEDYLNYHPEERAEIDSYIHNFLQHREADNQFTVSEYIRIAYERIEASQTQNNQAALFKNKEDIYGAFNDLIIESEANISLNTPERIAPAIRDFIAHKEEYLRAHPEERDEVNGYIKDALEHKEADEQFTVSEYIRIAYKEADVKAPAQPVNENTGNDNKGQAPLTIGAIPGNGNENENTGNDNKGQAPLTVGAIPGNGNENENTGNGGGGNGGTGNGGKDQDPPLNVGVVPQTQTQPEKEKDETFEQEMVEEYRKLSANGDQNDALMDNLRIQALMDMGKVKNVDMNTLTEQGAIEILHDTLPELSDKELKDMESRVTDLILTPSGNGQQARRLGMVPPLVLADKYEELSEVVNKTKSGPEHDAALDKLNKVGDRIDSLASQLLDKQTNRDLWFNDYTNIADIHYGYSKMFAAREKDLIEMAKEGNQSADQRVGIMRRGMAMLDEEVTEYDRRMNLSHVTDNSADILDKHFDEVKPRIDGIVPTAETLELVSRYKFKDEQGRIEPQFELPDGTRSDDYAQGAKIIEGSKLDTMLKMAKQDVLLESLGATESEITDEKLATEVNDRLQYKLYEIDAEGKALDLARRLKQDGEVMAKDEFKNADNYHRFLNELRQEPKTCNNAVYEIARDKMVEKNRAFTQRLAQKINSQEHPVLFKVMDSVKDFDKRAEDRSTGGKISRKQIWKNIGKRAALGGGIAFATSFVLSTGAAAMASDAALTAQTMGMNKFAGAIMGTALGIGAMALHVKKWRKAQKEQGKPAGIKAFLKNPQNLASFATSALAGVATGAMITGNPGVAQLAGYGALAIGGMNNAITSGAQVKKAGGNYFDAVAGGLLIGGATLGGGYLGRYTSNLAIDLFNKEFPNNTVFQNKHTHTEHIQDGKDEFVFHDKNEVIKGSQQTLDNFYKGNEAQLKADLADIRDFYKAHGIDFPEERALVMLADGGTNTNTDTVNYTPHGNVHTHGNNLCMNHNWADTKGLDHAVVDALNVPRGPDGHLMMNMDAHNAIMKVNPFVSAHNAIGYVPNTETYGSGIPLNASRDGANIPVENLTDGKEFGTYINHGGVGEWVHTDPIDKTVTEFTPNHGNIMATFGYYLKPMGKRVFKMGSALADKIISVVRRKEPPIKKKKPYVKPEVTIKIPEEHKYLNEEYWMIHGYNPSEKKLRGEDGKYKSIEINPMLDPGYKAYVENVKKEFAASGGKSMLEFLQQRRQKFDQIVEANASTGFVGSFAQRSNAEILDPVGHKQVLEKQAELAKQGKTMSKDEIDKAIKWPTPEEMNKDYEKHRPTSMLVRIIRDAFWRKDNGVEVTNPKQRSTVEINGKTVEGNKKVFSFNEFTDSAKDALTRTTNETNRDHNKAPVRRTIDEMGKMTRHKNR